MELTKLPTQEDLDQILGLIDSSPYSKIKFKVNKFGREESLLEALKRTVSDPGWEGRLYILRDGENIAFALFDRIGEFANHAYISFLFSEGGLAKDLLEILKQEFSFVFANLFDEDGKFEARKRLARLYGGRVEDTNFIISPYQRYNKADVVFSKNF